MAKRPIQKKQAARMRKLLTRNPLPAYIDLIAWLKAWGHADTTGKARQIILEGRVKSDSHALGLVRNVPVELPSGEVVKQDIVDPAIPVAAFKNVTVSAK